MFPFIEILSLILSSSFAVLLEPFVWLVLLLVGFQYRQQQQSQERMFGVAASDWKRQLLRAAWLGLVGGWLGSLLLTLTGVTVNYLGLAYVWPVAIGLMLIHARFLCFAYAGGLVALSCLLFGWPQVSVPHLLALVAILHITESFLIAVSGRFSAAPVFLRQGDRLVGAFMLQNFWPLPLVILLVAGLPTDKIPEGMINMPDWWPPLAFGHEPPEGQQWVHMLVPVVAALGYSDIAVSTRPEQKRRQSALYLFAYSLTLLALALMCGRYPWLQLPAALLSPVGHDLLIWLQNRQELRGRPLFVHGESGLTVLDTVSGSPARAAGIRPGDVLLSLYGMPLNDEAELTEAIACAPRNFRLNWQREGVDMQAQASFADGERWLGIILAPRGYEPYIELDTASFGLLRRLKRLFNRM
ncbi:MAG: PDZ domain-containing protein [Sporomusaceae bacterium]|nr:PDZ domain-containing protein [Sporomusaceae bacterium]